MITEGPSHIEALTNWFKLEIKKGELDEEKYMATARWYFKSTFDEREDVNYDEIKISFENVTLNVVDKPAKITDLMLKYGNLYSYVLANGLVVSYNQWVYENEITYRSPADMYITYRWDEDGYSKQTRKAE